MVPLSHLGVIVIAIIYVWHRLQYGIGQFKSLLSVVKSQKANYTFIKKNINLLSLHVLAVIDECEKEKQRANTFRYTFLQIEFL